jgi:serine/threonine-protein kinase
VSDVLDRLKSALADRYSIERELGSGGMATVYLADDLKHHRKVAVKVLRPELAAALGPDRFLREIQLTAQLNHPHILPLLDSGEAESFLYYVMPYVAGESLRQWLERETQLPIDEALRIIQQVAAALEFAHRQAVIHRDIKPENVLLHEGEAMVADFGIALAVSAAGGKRLTETGVSVGTVEYMSPEQALGEGEPDERSDIYSLGCVLYEMLVGEPPYTGPTAMAVLAKRLSDPVPSARRLRAAIPVPVDAALVRALAKERVDRFGSAREFVEALVAEAGADAEAVKSIAVLPFANLSAEPESEYFSDGITFDIINHLAKISDLKVISRTSIMRYKTTDKPLRRIGEELGVAAIVEGEVQRVGDRVRIGAQLVDARTDEHLWAEQYDRELLDVFAIQTDVAHRVAAALKATLTAAEKERIERRPTDDSEAYNLYLKGRYFFDRRGEGLWKGLEYFQQALEIDPDYALAHAGVADCYALLGFYGNLPAGEAWPGAKAAALRALEIDEGLAEAHCSLGFAGV